MSGKSITGSRRMVVYAMLGALLFGAVNALWHQIDDVAHLRVKAWINGTGFDPYFRLGDAGWAATATLPEKYWEFLAASASKVDFEQRLQWVREDNVVQQRLRAGGRSPNAVKVLVTLFDPLVLAVGALAGLVIGRSLRGVAEVRRYGSEDGRVDLGGYSKKPWLREVQSRSHSSESNSRLFKDDHRQR